MVKRIARIVVVFVIAATPFLASTPAQAASWACDPGYSCYYTEHGGDGSRWVAPSGGCHHPLPSGFQDNISSVYNRGHGTAFVHLYNWVGSWEHLITVAPGDKLNLYLGRNNTTDRICIDS
ncbi:peptidase inhibitor family I36 protein [Nonomuraea sp. NPDC049141]|uniref:peptidase inhibitor family I36 protein n=1 Tax=Nonomuraea sp. NPDC049141 TaxID=3155500 RepID=UPI0033D2A4A0